MTNTTMKITQLLRNHTQIPSKYCGVILETTFLLDTVVIVNHAKLRICPQAFSGPDKKVYTDYRSIITSSLSKFIKLWGINYNSNILGNGSEKPITDFFFLHHTSL